MFDKLDPQAAGVMLEDLKNGKLPRDLRIKIEISRSAFEHFVIRAEYEFKDQYLTTSTEDTFVASNEADMLLAVEEVIETYVEKIPTQTK